MRLSQEAIQRMISGRSGGGVGGGGSFDPSALAGYATQAWTEENYISKTFFNELFIIHKKVTTVVMDGDTEISRTVTTDGIFAPNEIPGTTTDTDEETGYVTTVTTEISSIESKKGFWTNYFLSALGLNGEGGGGGITLNEPLASINDAGLASHPSSSGQTIVWNGTAWVYGTAGGGTGTVTGVKVGDITYSPVNGIVSIPAYPTSMAWSAITSKPTTIAGYGITDAKIENGVITLGSNTITPLTSSAITDMATKTWVGQQGFALTSNVYSKTDADAKFMTIAAFENLFNALNSSDQKVSHPYSSGVASIKAMVGLWTEQYLSALGKSDSGGEIVLNEPLASINDAGLASHPSSSGQTIVWNGNAWTYGTAGGGNITAGTGLTGGTATGTISISSEYLTKINHGESAYNTVSNMYTKNEVDTKFVSIAFFNKLFQAYKSTTISEANKVLPNDVQTTIDNLKIMVGAWTEQYLSALGKSDSGGSTFDESAMWIALGTNISQKQISSTYLTNALAPYALKTDIPSLKSLSWSYGGVTAASGNSYNGATATSFVIPKNTSHLVNDSGFITSSVLGSYLPLSGGTLTGNLNIKYPHDLSKSNNDVSDTLWPGYRIYDKDGRRSAQFVNGVYSSGSNFVWMGVSNYDTSGNMIADYGIGLSVDKNGAGTWSISEPAAFRTAIGIPALLGGYLPLSGGTMTGTLKVATGIGIEDATGNGLLVYHPTNWRGISASQWGAGAVDCQGVIRSNASDLKHYRGSALYNILDSYNSGISGSTITINGTSINSVAYIEVGTNDLTGYSGSFFFGGGGALQSGYDYVGFQAGGGTDKWQVVAINNLKWRQNDNGGTDTTGWSDWRTILDSYNSGVINGKVTLNSTSLNVPISYNLPTPGTFTSGYWHRLGNYVTAGDGNNLVITIYDGNGYNGYAEQNSIARIVIKDGWQSTRAAANSVGVSIERSAYFFDLQVSVVATEHNAGALWVYLPWQYAQGTYTVEGIYTSWEHHNGTDGDTTTAPVTNQTLNTSSQHSYLYFDYAYLTSNVASATKLQTTRYIWGNAFNGTADINGNLIMPNNRGIVIKDTNGVEQNVFTYNQNNDVVIGWGPRSTSDTYITGNTISIARNGGANGFYINTSNNIGLGGSGDSSHKLYVQGSTLLKHSGGESLTLDTTATYNCIVYQINAASKWSVGTDANGTFYWYTQPGGNNTVMSLTSAGILNVGNSVKCTDLWIGNIHITYDSANGGIHVANGGLSANTYVSALGVGQEGGGSQGLDIEAMWTELATPNSARQIDSSHISSALSNYVTTNTLSGYASQQWVNQQGFVKTSGVTSVAMSVPSSLRVNTGSGATITSSGTFAITLASGYSIPTTAQQSNWDTAYGWGNHATAGYSTPQGVANQMQSYAYISGNVIHIGDSSITPLTSHQSVDGTFWGRSWSNHGTVSGNIEAGNSGGYIGGFDHIDLNTHASLYGYGGYIDFYYNGSNSYTSRIIETSAGTLSFASASFTPMYYFGCDAVNSMAGLHVGVADGSYIQIGSVRLVYDSANNALKVQSPNGGTANLYATGGVSALGIGQESGSGSDATFDTLTVESGLWVYDEIHCTSDIYGDNLYINNDAEVSTLYYEYLLQSSDMRLKDVVRMVDLDVETIGRAPLFEFRWKSRPNALNIGTSAQYWKAAMPQVVGEDRNHYLSMDYAATALAGVISVARTVMTHEEEIAALKSRLSSVEQENKAIKLENQWLRNEIEQLKAA